ncbi:MAG: hypothetical protein WBM50_09380 [Acidimicrobiales bacterium]|jgi:hypothetical protein
MDMNRDSGTFSNHPPIVCTLTAEDAAAQVLDWIDLQNHATKVSALDRGVRMTFPASLLDAVEDLARRERGCCGFLSITTALDNEILSLDISSQNPDALPVISALAGIELP